MPDMVRNSAPSELDKDYMWVMAFARATGRSDRWSLDLYQHINGRPVDKTKWPSRNRFQSPWPQKALGDAGPSMKVSLKPQQAAAAPMPADDLPF